MLDFNTLVAQARSKGMGSDERGFINDLYSAASHANLLPHDQFGDSETVCLLIVQGSEAFDTPAVWQLELGAAGMGTYHKVSPMFTGIDTPSAEWVTGEGAAGEMPAWVEQLCRSAQWVMPSHAE